MTKIRTKVLVECAIMIALATVLSLIKVYEFPFGGSVTVLSMLPIILISYRRGLGAGLSSAFVYSIIQLLLGFNNLSYATSGMGVVGIILFDYILPFTVLGLAAIFYRDTQKGEKALFSIIAGTFMVLTLRYLFHVVGGAIIWYGLSKPYAEEGDWILTVGPWVYSFGYNISYMGPELAITLAASPLIIKLKDIFR